MMGISLTASFKNRRAQTSAFELEVWTWPKIPEIERGDICLCRLTNINLSLRSLIVEAQLMSQSHADTF